jgi:hypothetical protein
MHGAAVRKRSATPLAVVNTQVVRATPDFPEGKRGSLRLSQRCRLFKTSSVGCVFSVPESNCQRLFLLFSRRGFGPRFLGIFAK